MFFLSQKGVSIYPKVVKILKINFVLVQVCGMNQLACNTLTKSTWIVSTCILK